MIASEGTQRRIVVAGLRLRGRRERQREHHDREGGGTAHGEDSAPSGIRKQQEALDCFGCSFGRVLSRGALTRRGGRWTRFY